MSVEKAHGMLLIGLAGKDQDVVKIIADVSRIIPSDKLETTFYIDAGDVERLFRQLEKELQRNRLSFSGLFNQSPEAVHYTMRIELVGELAAIREKKNHFIRYVRELIDQHTPVELSFIYCPLREDLRRIIANFSVQE